MTSMRRITLALALALLLLPSLALAQNAGPPVNVQQSGTPLNACTLYASATSSSTATTITITPPSGQYVMLCEVDIQMCGAVTAAIQQKAEVTTTGLSGATAPRWMMALPGTAGQCASPITVTYPNGMKSAAPGTAVTFVVPAIDALALWSVNVGYWFAP